MVHCRAIKGSEWFVCIGGFRDVDIRDVEVFLEKLKSITSPLTIQVLNAKHIAGWEHLFFAAVNAVKALDSKKSLSKSLGVEVLLYASCQDQISTAFQIFGVSPGVGDLALIVFSKDRESAEESFRDAAEFIGVEDDRVLEIEASKFQVLKHFFNISDLELETRGGENPEALTSLIIERGALLSVHR
ncbi:MAG: KEOPS complex subunit Cgi121 [Candidatus Bathyarchaeia archaeon]